MNSPEKWVQGNAVTVSWLAAGMGMVIIANKHPNIT